MTDPEIYLAVDNCFAKKRWTRPSEWVKLIKLLGVDYIEASADNECDPLYTTEDYMNDWLHEVKKECDRNDAAIANFYSGHGTYSTLGLAHTDIRIREKILNKWLKPMALYALKTGAGLGFYCHAFPDAVLQNPQKYERAEADLYARLAKFSGYCDSLGLGNVCVEQMYSPNQIPWTIEGTKKLLKSVYGLSGKPFYITIDTGHQTGQRRYLQPGYEEIKEAVRTARAGSSASGLWLGPESGYILFDEAVLANDGMEDEKIHAIISMMEAYPYMFAEYSDGNPYAWLENLACYSPIIHLQQTEGISSSHMPFGSDCCKGGIILADRVLKAICLSYKREEEYGMPPVCDRIYLTLEIFSGTGETGRTILDKMKSSVKYWRDYIPIDGMRLSSILKHIKN